MGGTKSEAASPHDSLAGFCFQWFVFRDIQFQLLTANNTEWIVTGTRAEVRGGWGWVRVWS